MDHLIDRYLEDHESAWSYNTWRSEKSRLRNLGSKLNKKPEELYQELSKTMKPYTLKTVFIRIAALEKWANQEGLLKERPYERFLGKHRNRFKHVYQSERIEIDFDEASRRVETLAEPYKSFARDLLRSGLRISEAYGTDGERVLGKGGKFRKIFVAVDRPRCSQSALRAALKVVGLRPHQLRKLAATRAASRGASPADLCKIFGWSSITTAYQYLQPQNDERLMELMK